MSDQIINFDVSADLIAKGCTIVSNGGFSSGSPYLSALPGAISDWINAQIGTEDLPIYHGTLSSLFPVPHENLYTLLNQNPVSMYNRFIHSNGNLGRVNIDADDISFFLVVVTEYDSSSNISISPTDFYIIFLTL